MRLEEINWPVFRLGEIKPDVDKQAIYYYTEYYDLVKDEYFDTFKVVDDTSVKGNTIGTRRLKLLHNGVKLFNIKLAIYFVADLMKLAKSTTWFIDTYGTLFQYKKTKTVKLTCHKIKNILRSSDLGSIIELDGIAQRFKTTAYPGNEYRYAGIVKYGNGFLLYGIYTDIFKNTNRRI